MNDILKTKNVDYVIAGDTDSCYLDMSALVNRVFRGMMRCEPTAKQGVEFLDRVVKEKIEPFIQTKYEQLAEYMNATQQMMFMSREVIAERGIWTAKKRYMLLVNDSEGVRYETPELKIMGFETARSSTPEIVREHLKKAVRIILTKTEDDLIGFVNECRKVFREQEPEDIAFPRSVSNMSKYSDPSSVYKKGTPIHVRGALVFNRLLEDKCLTNRHESIGEGEKIKFLYLREPNPIHENVITFISGLPEEFDIRDYIDYDVQFEKTFLAPLQSIMEVIGWSTEKRYELDI